MHFGSSRQKTIAGLGAVVYLTALSLLIAVGPVYPHDPRLMEIMGLGAEMDEADLALYRGHALVRNGQYHQAINEYTTAILLKPYPTLALISRGITYMDIGEFREALKDLDSAASLDPSEYEIFINRAMVYSRMENYDSALADCNRAIELDSLQPEAYTNRGIYLSQLGNLKQALSECIRALEIDSTYSPAWLSRTMIYLELGDMNAATECFKQLLRYQTPEQAVIIERLKYFVDTTSSQQP